MRKAIRIAFWCLLLGALALLKLMDILSTRPSSQRSGIRLVTVNVATTPVEVARTLQSLQPDLVFMQETSTPCVGAARVLGLLAADGSDQCLLSRWPLKAGTGSWPGPWQPPQLVTMDHPGHGQVVLVNARLALPLTVAGLSGNAWYTAAERRRQFTTLRGLLEAERQVIVCGDLNALPFEVDLGPRFRDLWSRFTYGGTFPAWLPAARIDQCWATSEFATAASWTQVVPSDHRAVVVDLYRIGDP
jgi:endonuclease/exonuclease/phosphatase family metal-dependent hydrolase